MKLGVPCCNDIVRAEAAATVGAHMVAVINGLFATMDITARAVAFQDLF